VTHGNTLCTLRALIKQLDNINDESKLMCKKLEIVDLNIPTGLPLVYEFGFRPNPITHYYLARDAELRDRLKKYEESREHKY